MANLLSDIPCVCIYIYIYIYIFFLNNPRGVLHFFICYLLFPYISEKAFQIILLFFPDKNIKSHKDKSFPQNPKATHSDASFKVKVLFSFFPVKTLHQTPDLQMRNCHLCSPSPVLAHQSIFSWGLSALSVWLLLKE